MKTGFDGRGPYVDSSTRSIANRNRISSPSVCEGMVASTTARTSASSTRSAVPVTKNSSSTSSGTNVWQRVPSVALQITALRRRGRDEHPEVARLDVGTDRMQTGTAVGPNRREERQADAVLIEESLARGRHVRHGGRELCPRSTHTARRGRCRSRGTRPRSPSARNARSSSASMTTASPGSRCDDERHDAVVTRVRARHHALPTVDDPVGHAPEHRTRVRHLRLVSQGPQVATCRPNGPGGGGFRARGGRL